MPNVTKRTQKNKNAKHKTRTRTITKNTKPKIKASPKEYFEEVRSKKYFVEKHIPKFANFKKYKNKNVLEIGCGIGTDAIEFIRNGSNYTGIDFSEKSSMSLKLSLYPKPTNHLLVSQSPWRP